MGEVAEPALFDEGYFVRPTLVVGPDPGLGIVRGEQFGPVVPILPFSREDEAVRLANDSNYAWRLQCGAPTSSGPLR